MCIRDREFADLALSGAHEPRNRVPDYLWHLREANREFAEVCRSLKRVHFEEHELVEGLEMLARLTHDARHDLTRFVDRYGEQRSSEVEQLRSALFPRSRAGPFGALRDLHSLLVMATDIHVAITVSIQAAMGLRDDELLAALRHMAEQNKRQQAWLTTQIKHRAVQTIVVPS